MFICFVTDNTKHFDNITGLYLTNRAIPIAPGFSGTNAAFQNKGVDGIVLPHPSSVETQCVPPLYAE